MKLTRFFTPALFIGLNLLIILLSVFVGGGIYFEATGLIHLIAIVFVALTLFVIFSLGHLQDVLFRSFFKAFAAAMVLFSSVHVLEYLALAYTPAGETKNIVDMMVITLYLLGFFMVTLGMEFVLMKDLEKYRPWISFMLPAVIVAVGLNVGMLLSPGFAEVIGESVPLLLFTLLALAQIAAVAIVAMKLRKIFDFLDTFGTYVIAGSVAMVAAVLFEFLEIYNPSWLTGTYTVYLAHYAFYAALSIFLLGFNKLFDLGGVYKDMLAAKEEKGEIGV